MFCGNDRRCDTCGSVVRILWVTFARFPVFPLGTYRYRLLGGSRERISRRMQTNPRQVATHYAVATLVFVALVAVCAVIAELRYRNKRGY